MDANSSSAVLVVVVVDLEEVIDNVEDVEDDADDTTLLRLPTCPPLVASATQE